MEAIGGLLVLAAEAARSEPAGWRHWLNENGGAIAAVGVAATVVYVRLTYKLWRAAIKVREDHNWLARSEQARLIGRRFLSRGGGLEEVSESLDRRLHRRHVRDAIAVGVAFSFFRHVVTPVLLRALPPQ